MSTDLHHSLLSRLGPSVVAHLMGRVFRQQNRAFGRALGAVGLTPLQAQILVPLWMLGPIRVGRLQRLLALSSSTFTGAVDRMERAQLLERSADPTDRRAVVLRAAAWPQADQRAVTEALDATAAACYAALTPAEVDQLVALLTRVSDHLAAGETALRR